MRLLREHPQRAGVDAGALVGQLPQRGVRLPGVRRAEVRDDALGRGGCRAGSEMVIRFSAGLDRLRRTRRRARSERLGRF